jgi:hypothetical protein
MAARPRPRVRFSRQVLVYSARPSQLFYERRLVSADDFDFAPRASALRTAPAAPQKAAPCAGPAPRAPPRLLLLGALGYCLIAYLSPWIAPADCRASFGPGAHAMGAVQAIVPFPQSDPRLAHGGVVLAVVAMLLNLVSGP